MTDCLSPDPLQELTSPRLIKSHLPYRFLPSDLHNGDSKVMPCPLPLACALVAPRTRDEALGPASTLAEPVSLAFIHILTWFSSPLNLGCTSLRPASACGRRAF